MSRSTAPGVAIGALAFIMSQAVACADPAPGPAIGAVEAIGAAEVTVATSGESVDPDGYSVRVASVPAQPVAINGTITLSALAAGDHAVALNDVAANCAVIGDNPRTVRVSAGATARIDFAIACVTVGASVTVEPGTLALDPGAAVQLVATPRDGRGTPLSGRAVAWVSANPTVATVLPSGLVSAVAAGGTTVTATVEGISGSAVVMVTGTPVNLHGEWSFLEVYSEAFCSMEGPCYSYAECSDTGSFDFTQTDFAFVGTGNQVGSCELGERAVTGGRIAGRRITFTAGACQYQGELSALLDSLNASGECADGRTTTVLAYRRASQ